MSQPFKYRIDREWLGERIRDGAELSIGTPMTAIGESPPGQNLRLCPLLVEHVAIGLTAASPDQGWTTLFLAPEARGLGLGDRVLEKIDADGLVLGAPESSDLADYALVRAFLPQSKIGLMRQFSSPSQRSDLRAAASVCLVDRARRKLLLGRRLTDPYPYFWAFPGGKLEPGESPLEAAVRELHEETGVDVRGLKPVAVNTVYVAYRDGRRAYSIDNFLIIASNLPQPVLTAEIEPHWLAYDEAMRARPMAAGTRRVLRKVRRQLGL